MVEPSIGVRAAYMWLLNRAVCTLGRSRYHCVMCTEEPAAITLQHTVYYTELCCFRVSGLENEQ